jgi:hypothetical protein
MTLGICLLMTTRQREDYGTSSGRYDREGFTIRYSPEKIKVARSGDLAVERGTIAKHMMASRWRTAAAYMFGSPAMVGGR